MMIQVKGHPNLYRDEQTGAIINYDNASYNQYIESLNQRDYQKKQIEKMRNDIDEIKILLKSFIEKNN